MSNRLGENRCPCCGKPSLASEVCEPCSLAAAPCSVESTSRQVIEKKLLLALGDESTVAILATKQDLEDMVLALESYDWNGERKARCRNLAAGMQQLLREAFPPNTKASEPGP